MGDPLTARVSGEAYGGENEMCPYRKYGGATGGYCSSNSLVQTGNSLRRIGATL